MDVYTRVLARLFRLLAIPVNDQISSSNIYFVRVANACDAGGSYAVKSFYVSCSGMMVYEVSPNPATSDVTITPAEETTAAGNKTTTATSGATITEVNIYDQQGILKKRQKFNNQKQVKVNVSTLRTGIYFLEIADTNHRERHQLSVLR